MTKEYREYQLNRVLEGLKKAVPDAEKHASEMSEVSLQMAAKAGWLEGSITCAIIELEVLLGKK